MGENVTKITKTLKGEMLLEFKQSEKKEHVGWVVSRNGEKSTVQKCYGCMEVGRVAKSCKAENVRNKCCLKCSEKRYRALGSALLYYMQRATKGTGRSSPTIIYVNY
uniref:CCHC-type domain-containing protein n=1 Tax=Glossina brevipalpis TaxID=37001 RepID=A0A1A9WXK2_9MUSC